MTASCKSCSVKTVIEETESIDKLETFIEHLNAQVLHSFKVRLVMEESESETDEDQGDCNLNG